MPVSIDPLGMMIPMCTQLVLALFANMTGEYGYNMAVFVVLVVAYYLKNQHEPLLLAGLLVAFSMFLDIIVMGTFGKSHVEAKGKYRDIIKFTFGMTVLNFLIKPFTAFVTMREYNSRGGDALATLRGAGSQYEAVDNGAAEAGVPSNFQQAPAYAPREAAAEPTKASAPPAAEKAPAPSASGYQSSYQQQSTDDAPF